MSWSSNTPLALITCILVVATHVPSAYGYSVPVPRSQATPDTTITPTAAPSSIPLASSEPTASNLDLPSSPRTEVVVVIVLFSGIGVALLATGIFLFIRDRLQSRAAHREEEEENARMAVSSFDSMRYTPTLARSLRSMPYGEDDFDDKLSSASEIEFSFMKA